MLYAHVNNTGHLIAKSGYHVREHSVKTPALPNQVAILAGAAARVDAASEPGLRCLIRWPCGGQGGCGERAGGGCGRGVCRPRRRIGPGMLLCRAQSLQAVCQLFEQVPHDLHCTSGRMKRFQCGAHIAMYKLETRRSGGFYSFVRCCNADHGWNLFINPLAQCSSRMCSSL